MGRLIRGTSESARFVVADTKDIIQEIVDKQNIKDKTTVEILSKIVGFAIMLSTSLKDFKLLTVRVDSQCYLKTVVVTMEDKNHVKAYVSISENEINETTATLRVIIDKGLSKPYTSIANIDYKNLMDDISLYFYNSEQIPTMISLGASLGSDETKVEHAGALMLQILPNASEEFITKIERKASMIRPVNELFQGGMTLEDMAELLFDDMDSESPKRIEDYEILGEENLSFFCGCSREKFLNALHTLGKKEIDSILEEDGKIESVCYFCNTKYEFKEGDFNED